MTSKVDENIDALIFIDTNILLDFYRIKRSDISLKYLKEIEKHMDRIITSSQVEMEFKKNRQAVILESISEVKKNNNSTLSVPAVVFDSSEIKMIEDFKKKIDDQQKRIKERIENILFDPEHHDPVYESLLKLFKNRNITNLDREDKQRFSIRRLALKRYMLGYPPRKSNDTSIGDPINWEWIIKCAETTGKHIIIVTRDTDYGAIYENKSYINDWLKQEFIQRIGIDRKLILTDKLSMAFKLVVIPVTEEMIEEERKVIKFEDIMTDEMKNRIATLRELILSGYKNIDTI